MKKSKLNILVVDDHSPVRAIIKSQLRAMGYSQICEASDGIAAFEILKSKAISLIISDLHMPLMNGYELLEAVRQDADLTGTPFILVSGDATSQDINMALQLKVNQVILKPFTLQIFEEKIKQVVQ